MSREKWKAGVGNRRNQGNVKHNFMAHTAYYGLLPYIPMILQYYEILAYDFFLNSSLWHTDSGGFAIHAWPLLRRNIWRNDELQQRRCWRKQRRKWRWKYRFQIRIWWSNLWSDHNASVHGGGPGKDKHGAAAAAHYISMWRTIHLTYKEPIKYVP